MAISEGAAALGAAGLNTGAGLIGTHMGITAAKKAATKSWEQSLAMAAFQKSWEKEKMQNAYQWTMQDMEKMLFHNTYIQ